MVREGGAGDLYICRPRAHMTRRRLESGDRRWAIYITSRACVLIAISSDSANFLSKADWNVKIFSIFLREKKYLLSNFSDV